jgi:hypothetical protein
MSGGILDFPEDCPRQPPLFDWAAVDLRPGSPFGDLFAALVEWAIADGAFAPSRAGRRHREIKTLLADYSKARKKWPAARDVKPLCKLMHAHSRTVFGGRYNDVNAEALSKRVRTMLRVSALVEAHKKEPWVGWPTDPRVYALMATKEIRKKMSMKRRGLKAATGK